MGGVELVKGQNVVLEAQTAPTEIAVCWQVSNAPIELDVLALVLGPENRVRSDADMIFYNQPQSVDGSIRHLGRITKGGSDIDRLSVELANVPADVHALALVVSSEASLLSAVPQLRLEVSTDGRAMAQFRVSDLTDERVAVVGELYRRNGAWRLRAVGQGWASGLAALATDYGVTIEDAPSTTPDTATRHEQPSPASNPGPSVPPAAPGAPATGSSQPPAAQQVPAQQPSTPQPPSQPPAGWFPDPARQSGLRYWDGTTWTGWFASIHEPGSPAQFSVPPAPPVPTAEPARPGSGVRLGGRPAATREKVRLFGARRQAGDLIERNAELEALVDELGLADVAEVRRVLDDLQNNVRAAEAKLATLRSQLTDAEKDLVEAQGAANLQDVGYYRYHHPAESSVQLSDELARVRSQIKSTVQQKQAISATNNFTFNGSVAKGSKFVSDMSRIMLRAFNAEAENCVKSVRAGNLATAVSRLSKAAEQIEKQGTMVDLRVTPAYRRLRVKEIELAADFYQMVQEEKEAERARREELREAKRVEDELRREREKLDKELNHYTAAIATLIANGDTDGAAKLQTRLDEINQAIENVDYRAANQRAGYVYVISNIGAFGERMVKIGMTRRLDPMDRVNELGDASVPFRFDVHALFFSDNAVGVETALHQTFAAQRVNKVNHRREFFYATSSEVLAALRKQVGAVTEFTELAAAEEYRLGLGTSDRTV